MNNEKLRKARDTVYQRLIHNVIQAVGPFLGLPITPDLLKLLLGATKGLVDAGRNTAQNIAYQDYVHFVNNDKPEPKMELNRFTDELWEGTLVKITTDEDFLNSDMAEEVGMSADYWARDAEWGQRIDSAKKDPRIERVARVDPEPPSCPFCTLLNSRGAVYLSQESAARTLHKGDECTLVFVAVGAKTWPMKASNDLAKKAYDAAVKELPHGGPNAIMAKMREHGSASGKPGRVRTNANTAAKFATSNQLSEAQARLDALQKISPKSESARKYVADQTARNQQIIQALAPEAKTP